MGDGVITPFDEFLFFLVFVGTPALIFGGPIVVLVFLSARRTAQLNRHHGNDSDTSPRSPWLIALFVSGIVGAISFLVFGASISRLLMLP